MRRHGSAWALPPPALALAVAADPGSVCRGNVRVVPLPSALASSALHARGPCPHVHTHTREHTHLPQGKQPRITPLRGGCKELPPPTRSGGDPGTRSGCTGQLSPAPGSPKASLLCSADVPPALGWCPGAPWMGSSLHRASSASIQGSCPQLCSSLHPQILGCGCSPA